VLKAVPPLGLVHDTTTATVSTATGAGTIGSDKIKSVVGGLDAKPLLFGSDTPIQGDLPIDIICNFSFAS
jgi:hypothetical protein